MPQPSPPSSFTLQIPPSLSGRGLLLAFSGGLDSSVLLHRLLDLAPLRLRAVHVHHGLQACADDWARHCQACCDAVGVPIRILRVRVDENGGGPEADARKARYAALRACLGEGEALVTAHHQDDQAETVLLRLMRGSGVQGLAGMRALSGFPPGWLWRPLLQVPRSELRAEAEARGLHWVEDPHNRDRRYARSFLRTDILPRLAEHWPAVCSQLAHAAELQREASELLNEVAEQDLVRLRQGTSLRPEILPIEELAALSGPRRRNLLRRWIADLGLPTPFQDSLLRVDAEVLAADPEGEPRLAWPGAELRRYRQRVYAMPTLPPAPAGFLSHWSGYGSLDLPPGCGELCHPQPRGAGPAAEGFEVRVPAPAGRFKPAGSSHSRALKNLFQERGIPPWVRRRTPALEREGSICWIGGIGWAQGVEAIPVEWRNRPTGSADG